MQILCTRRFGEDGPTFSDKTPQRKPFYFVVDLFTSPVCHLATRMRTRLVGDKKG
jgi:hypothetical protein